MITINIKEHNKLADKYSAFISFDYDYRIVACLREMPFKNYNPENTEWEIPVLKVKSFIKQLPMFNMNIIGKITELKESNIIELPDGFKFKTAPFNHQLKGVVYGLKNKNWFLGDEQGLGKTKQAIDVAVAHKISLGYKHCLVVCGVNTLKWNWTKEIKTHSDEGAYILGQRLKHCKIVINSNADKLSDLIRLEKDSNSLPYFIITNVESFRDSKIAAQIKKLCDLEIINMCVADEMHKMKNPTVQQTKGFLTCLPKNKIGMTGTPLMNCPLDLYVILKWLGYETHSFYSFKNHYCIMGGFGNHEVVGYKNLEQLTAQLNEIMLRRLKSEVLDLPDKLYVAEYVDMSKEQSNIYNEVEADIKSNIDMVAFKNNPLATLIRLRQATGYTGILSSTVKESAKLDRMEDLVEECIANNEKVIIFSNWTQITDVVQERIGNLNIGCVCITGNTKDDARQNFVDAFQKEEWCKVIIGTIGAMGTGLTLTAATTVIFLDEPWNKALFDQAVDRAHRIGTTENVTIYSILCKDTIDERIHELIYKKGAISDAIVDGKITKNNVEIFNYLLS